MDITSSIVYCMHVHYICPGCTVCVCGNKIGVKQALNNYGHLQQYYEFIACMYLHVHVHVHCMDITSSIIILFIACMDITFVQDAQCVCVGIKLVLNKLLIIMDISSSIMNLLHACIYMYMYMYIVWTSPAVL